MTLHQLLHFKKTAECRNITKAAGELYISQPSLSISLKKLETEMHTDLLKKEGHTLSLTPAGEVVLSYADKILQLVDELNQKIEDMQDSEQEKIRFGYITPLSKLYIPRLLTELQALYEEQPVQINAAVMNTRQIADALERGVLDFGLCCKVDGMPSLMQIPVLEQPLVIVCSREHELAKKFADDPAPRVSLQDLVDYDFISYDSESQISAQISAFFHEQCFTPRTKYTMDSEKEILHLVKNNLGVSLIARTDDLDPDEVFCLKLKEKDLSRNIFLTYRTSKGQSELVQRTLRYISR